jgi:hypothetical protein
LTGPRISQSFSIRFLAETITQVRASLRYRASISTLSGRIAGENVAAGGVCSACHSLTNEDRKAVGRFFVFTEGPPADRPIILRVFCRCGISCSDFRNWPFSTFAVNQQIVCN